MIGSAKLFLFILSICFCAYSQISSVLHKINSNGGKPSVDTIPDTTYYQSENFSEKEKIYSITYYNLNKTVKQYTTYFVNREINYYCKYEYTGTQCTKEIYYNSKNQITGFAEYTNNSFGGKNYTYFNKDTVQLYEIQYDSALSAYDSSWQCRVYTVRTANNAAYTKKYYQYSSGWLEKESYLNYKNDTTAIGLWGYDPVSKVTAYNYALKNGKYLTGKIPGVQYDQYRYYYFDTNKNADSCRIYKQNAPQQSKLLYTIKYIYDSKGWLKQEKFYNNENVLSFQGEYTFDKASSTTVYSFFQEPSLLLNKYTTDYRGVGVEFQQYNAAGKLHNSVKYHFNEGLYWDTVSAYDSTGALLSYETYSYYLPYYLVKNYSTFDSQKKMLSSYNYDEFGNVTDSIVVPAKISEFRSALKYKNGVSFQNNSIVISSYQNAIVKLQLFDLSGKMLYNNTRTSSGTRMVLVLPRLLNDKAHGNYFYNVSIDAETFSGMLHFNH